MGRTSWFAADLPVGSPDETSSLTFHYHFVTFYRRRLPHLYSADCPVFLTWRLYGSLAAHRSFPETSVNSGRAFATMDRLLEKTRTGPFYLRQPAIADVLVEILFHNSNVLGRYTLHAFAVMPNHIHLLVSPHAPLPKVTKALKSYTAKKANEMLGRTGKAFWQQESYDHQVRDAPEGERIRSYIEQNPVRAGLVQEASEYRWSSAGWATGRSPPDQEVHPTKR